MKEIKMNVVEVANKFFNGEKVDVVRMTTLDTTDIEMKETVIWTSIFLIAVDLSKKGKLTKEFLYSGNNEVSAAVSESFVDIMDSDDLKGYPVEENCIAIADVVFFVIFNLMEHDGDHSKVIETAPQDRVYELAYTSATVD